MLASAGIPLAGLALIIGVDRILDMARTSVNVTGDLVASSVMDKYVGGRTTAAEQLAQEAEREKLRAETGADLILEPQKF